MTSQVLVIADKSPLMNAILATLEPIGRLEATGMLWSQTPAFLSPASLRECDLVVAELYRNYPNGRRAEAVVLAERYLGTTPFLIVAPQCRAREIDCPGYWDVDAPDTLPERAAHLLRHPEEAARNFDRLKESVAHALAVPKQH